MTLFGLCSSTGGSARKPTPPGLLDPRPVSLGFRRGRKSRSERLIDIVRKPVLADHDLTQHLLDHQFESSKLLSPALRGETSHRGFVEKQLRDRDRSAELRVHRETAEEGLAPADTQAIEPDPPAVPLDSHSLRRIRRQR